MKAVTSLDMIRRIQNEVERRLRSQQKSVTRPIPGRAGEAISAMHTPAVTITLLSEHRGQPRDPAMGSDMVIPHHDTFRNA
jgi:hypothetical protein